MAKHATFSPSSAHRWMNCPASWGLEKHAPQTPPGESAMVGTIVHAMIERLLTGGKTPVTSGWYGNLTEKGWFTIFSSTPSGAFSFEITEKMIESANICVTLVRKILEKRPNAKLFVEQRMKIIPKTLGGTADIVILDADDRWGCVIDYKNGVKHVDVEQNPQLMIYAIGADMVHFENFPGAENIKDWTLGICQPNDFGDSRPVRTWKTTRDELNGFYDEVCEAIQTCRLVYLEDPKTEHFKLGPWCEWCKGEALCPLKKQALLKMVRGELSDLPEVNIDPVGPIKVESMDNNQLAWVLDNERIVTGFIDAAKRLAFERVHEGETVPGYKLVKSITRRTVSDEKGLSKMALSEGWDIWDKKLKTLGKLDKEVPKDQLKLFVTKPEGKPTLAPESDKRAAIENEILTMPKLENEILTMPKLEI